MICQVVDSEVFFGSYSICVIICHLASVVDSLAVGQISEKIINHKLRPLCTL